MYTWKYSVACMLSSHGGRCVRGMVWVPNNFMARRTVVLTTSQPFTVRLVGDRAVMLLVMLLVAALCRAQHLVFLPCMPTWHGNGIGILHLPKSSVPAADHCCACWPH